MSTLGDTLRAARSAAGLKQRQAADLLGVPHNYLSRWETGSNIPDRWHTSRLAEIYGLDQAALLAVRQADEDEREERRALAAAAEAALEDPDAEVQVGTDARTR